MPAVNPRTLLQRWFAGSILSESWTDARHQLFRLLRKLEDVLRVVHMAVEHPAPTIEGVYPCSGTVGVTATTDTALTGATVTFTPAVDMRVAATAHTRMQCTAFGAITHYATISLYVNGSPVLGVVSGSFAAVDALIPGSQSWVVEMSAGTTYNLALYGRTANVATTYSVQAGTRLLVVRFPNLFKVT